MGAKTKIEWTDATWNPLRGTMGRWHCQKVSEGCRYCYAEKMNVRFGGPEYKLMADDIKLSPPALKLPEEWKKPRMIFVCSMSDLFLERVSFKMILRIFEVMESNRQHTFQVLTKRPERMAQFCERFGLVPIPPKGFTGSGEVWPPNVWAGVSIENKSNLGRVSPLLWTPAPVRFLSLEPLLGPVDLDPVMRGKIQQVIVGGESGPQARPMNPEWVRSLRGQCLEYGIPFFFKQWGEWFPVEAREWFPVEVPGETGGVTIDSVFVGGKKIPHKKFGNQWYARRGKKASGANLDGRTWKEMPEGFSVGK